MAPCRKIRTYGYPIGQQVTESINLVHEVLNHPVDFDAFIMFLEYCVVTVRHWVE